MRRALLTLVLAAFILAPATAQEENEISFRNISSLTVDAFFDADIQTTIDQVLLITITPSFALELKILREDTTNFAEETESLNESTASIAPVLVWGGGSYSVFRYGFGFDSERRFSHEFETNTTHEKSEFVASYGVRGVYYPSPAYWFVVPSMGLTVFPAPGWSVMAKYFGSMNSADEVSSALWMEVSHQLNNWLGLKVGGTGEATSVPVEADRFKASGLVGAVFTLRENLRLRYQAEFLGSTDQARGIRNNLVFDVTF